MNQDMRFDMNPGPALPFALDDDAARQAGQFAVKLDDDVREETSMPQDAFYVHRNFMHVCDDPLAADMPVTLEPQQPDTDVYMLQADHIFVNEDDIMQFMSLHSNAPRRSRSRGGARRGRGMPRSDSVRRRQPNPWGALATHIVTRERDTPAFSVEYEAVMIRDRSEAEEVGSVFNPAMNTTLAVRRRRRLHGRIAPLEMHVGDWISVRDLNAQPGAAEEMLRIKDFRPLRRYKNQIMCDTAIIDCTT